MSHNDEKTILQETIHMFRSRRGRQYYFLSHGNGWLLFADKIEDGKRITAFAQNISSWEMVKAIEEHSQTVMLCPHCGKEILFDESKTVVAKL